MNEDIIRMAREAGMGGMLTDVVCTIEELERFAQLAAKKCADIADTAEPYKSADLIRKHFGVEE